MACCVATWRWPAAALSNKPRGDEAVVRICSSLCPGTGRLKVETTWKLIVRPFWTLPGSKSPLVSKLSIRLPALNPAKQGELLSPNESPNERGCFSLGRSRDAGLPELPSLTRPWRVISEVMSWRAVQLTGREPWILLSIQSRGWFLLGSLGIGGASASFKQPHSFPPLRAITGSRVSCAWRPWSQIRQKSATKTQFGRELGGVAPHSQHRPRP